MWTYALDWAHIPGASAPPHPSPPVTMKPADARLLTKMQQLAGKTHAFTREFFRQLRKNCMMPVQSQVACARVQQQHTRRCRCRLAQRHTESAPWWTLLRRLRLT